MLIQRKEKFGIRKLTLGVGSVLLGTGMYVSAEAETDSDPRNVGHMVKEFNYNKDTGEWSIKLKDGDLPDGAYIDFVHNVPHTNAIISSNTLQFNGKNVGNLTEVDFDKKDRVPNLSSDEEKQLITNNNITNYTTYAPFLVNTYKSKLNEAMTKESRIRISFNNEFNNYVNREIRSQFHSLTGMRVYRSYVSVGNTSIDSVSDSVKNFTLNNLYIGLSGTNFKTYLDPKPMQVTFYPVKQTRLTTEERQDAFTSHHSKHNDFVEYGFLEYTSSLSKTGVVIKPKLLGTTTYFDNSLLGTISMKSGSTVNIDIDKRISYEIFNDKLKVGDIIQASLQPDNIRTETFALVTGTRDLYESANTDNTFSATSVNFKVKNVSDTHLELELQNDVSHASASGYSIKLDLKNYLKFNEDFSVKTAFGSDTDYESFMKSKSLSKDLRNYTLTLNQIKEDGTTRTYNSGSWTYETLYKDPNLVLGDDVTGTVKYKAVDEKGNEIKSLTTVLENQKWNTEYEITPPEIAGYEYKGLHKTSVGTLKGVAGKGERVVVLEYRSTVKTKTEPVPPTYVSGTGEPKPG